MGYSALSDPMRAHSFFIGCWEMNGFYPGALCIIIESRCPENIGKTVQLILKCKATTQMTDANGFEHECTKDAWWVDAIGSKILHIDGDWTPQAFYTEMKLIPLSGDSKQFEQEHEKELVQ